MQVRPNLTGHIELRVQHACVKMAPQTASIGKRVAAGVDNKPLEWTTMSVPGFVAG